MQFRYARHTHNFRKLTDFYINLVGLERMGGFQDHDGYDGVFLGLPGLDWHLEFTFSDEEPLHQPDEDDALVFYVNSEVEIEAIRTRILQNSIPLEIPKNPYWKKNGIMIADPDGYKVIFSIQHLPFKSNDLLTNLVKEHALGSWSELINFTKGLRYGRNQNREDFSLVLKEMKGTCSSKHSFLKKIADLNQIENVKLILGMYKMNHLNTPKIGDTITKKGMEYIPEAHCYLKLNNSRIDITTESSEFEKFKNDLLEEIEIAPEQVNTWKVDFHRNYIRKWIEQNSIPFDFESVWTTREKCIQKLGE